MEEVLQFLHVGKRFRDEWVMIRFSLTLKGGEWVWLSGPAGSGKSMLVRMALGLIAPSSGSVIVNGANPAKLGYARRQRWRRNLSAALADEEVPPLRVRDWIALGIHSGGVPWRKSQERSLAALEESGLMAVANRDMRTIPRHLFFAAALVRGLWRNPALLLIDWPGAPYAELPPGLQEKLKGYIGEGGACLATGQAAGWIEGRRQEIAEQAAR